MVDLDGQARTAVGRGVQYVTILMGANDACTSSEATMTSVATFQAQFQQAMTTLTTGLPSASIRRQHPGHPQALGGRPRLVERAHGLVALRHLPVDAQGPTSTAQADVDRRAHVRQRVIEFNTALATVCA